jgi:predicted transcriptional regulator
MKKEKLIIYIDSEFKKYLRKLEKIAREEDRSISWIIRKIVISYVDRKTNRRIDGKLK